MFTEAFYFHAAVFLLKFERFHTFCQSSVILFLRIEGIEFKLLESLSGISVYGRLLISDRFDIETCEFPNDFFNES